jgi:hypothetical protein
MHLYQGPGYAARSEAPRFGVAMPRPLFLSHLLKCSLLLCAGLLFWPVCRAQNAEVSVSGRYACVQVKVQQKIQPCSAAPLILKNDGHFELRGWEGSYLVNGEWVELSDSLLKTRAKIEPGYKISIRYYGKDGLVEMIYERRVADLGKISLS